MCDKIVLATTNKPEDQKLINIAKRQSIDYFAGNELDKLVRWKDAAYENNIEFFVTADGDDLFCDPKLIDLAFKQYMLTGCDFIEEKPGEKVPVGAFTYGIKTDALNKVCEIKGTDDTEMMSIYFTETPSIKVQSLDNIPQVFRKPNIRMTLDYPEDLEFFRTVIGQLTERNQEPSLTNALSLIEANPHLVKINEFRNKDYLKNQHKKTAYIVKDEWAHN